MSDKKTSIDEALDPDLEKVFAKLAAEVEYSRHWDNMRTANHSGGAQIADADKSVGDWILFMEAYLSRAREAYVGNMDKTEALENIRMVAGLAVNCMIHNETPGR